MSVHVGELVTDMTVEGDEEDATTPAASPETSSWAQQERSRYLEQRNAELSARTSAVGFDD